MDYIVQKSSLFRMLCFQQFNNFLIYKNLNHLALKLPYLL